MTATLPRGSRLWLQFSSPDVWRLATDHALQLDVLEQFSRLSGRWWMHGLADRTPFEPTRLVDVCSGCVATVQNDDPGPCCQGATIEQVECYPASVTTGRRLDVEARERAKRQEVEA